MTRGQIQLLQIARREVERVSAGVFDEAQWRMTLRNIGNVKPDAEGRVSSRQLDNAGFDRVMAFLEARGFRDKTPDRPDDYWQKRSGQREGYATSRQIHLIRELAAQQTQYPIDAICLRITNDWHRHPEQLTVGQARKVIEAFQAIVNRQEAPAG